MEEVVEWRRDLHQIPELEFDTNHTAHMVSEILQSFDVQVNQGIGQTGLVGKLQSGNSSKAIGLRADMDGLPIIEQNTFSYRSKNTGKMHACGHDGHMAMLLGAAQVLSQKKSFNGTVYFIFQPNEERGLGAQAMIDDGLFERFQMDAVYGMHNMPGIKQGQFHIKSGPIMGAEDSFKIIIKGRGGHSSQPHNCIDPIVIGSQIVTSLQTITSRALDPLQSAVVSITDFKTDGLTNVIASQVEITGDCRSFDEKVQDMIASRMKQLVKNHCEAYGAEFEFDYQKLFYPTVNTEAETKAAMQAATEVVGQDKVTSDCAPLTASEDFSSMLRVKPGAYVLLGNGLDSKGGCVLHNPNYDFNDEIIPTGVNYWIRLVEQELK